MIELFLATLVWVAAPLFLFLRGVWEIMHPTGFVRELKATNENDRANHRLWELLHESDPVWLDRMGITEPDYLRRRRRPVLTNTPGAVIAVDHPGAVIVFDHCAMSGKDL